MPIEISIIIPLYNKENWIIETLESVESQTFIDWECLIVDDESSDNSCSLVKNFIASKGDRFRLITKKNSGQSASRNLGIVNAAGRYIAFLDADDLWASNKLEVQIQQLKNDDSSVCALSAYQIYNSQKPIRNLKFVQHHSTDKMIRRWLNMRGFGGGIESGGLVLKSALEKVGGFNEQLSTSSGLELVTRLSLTGKILYSNNTCFRYRKYEGQWHTFEKVLVENLSLLRRTAFSQSFKLERNHQAYILFSRFRTSPKSFVRDADLLGLCSLIPSLSLLLPAILLRNIRAKMIGVVKARRMQKLFF